MVDIYYLNVSPLDDGELFNVLRNELSAERQEKIMRYRFLKDRKLSLGAGLLLDYGLGCLGMRERDAVICYGEREKPWILGMGVEFNLSHSGDYVLAAFAGKPVGADIELIESSRPELARQFFSEGERDYIFNCPQSLRDEAFIRMWCLKESFSKAVGAGFGLPLNKYEISIGDVVSVRQQYDGNQYSFYEFGLPGYRAAVCSNGEEFCPVRELGIDIIWETMQSRR